MSNARKTGAIRDSKYDRFKRAKREMDIRPVFFIASEGENTEPDYFGKILAGLYPNIRVLTLPERKNIGAVRGNDPKKLKKRLQEKLREQAFESIVQREAWIVVDRDDKTWTVELLNEAAMWVKAENNKRNPVIHGMALSNPCFEFWLLLHFENGKGAHSSEECISRLKKRIHVPNYDKNKRLDDPNVIKLFSENVIKDAIKRSETKNRGLSEDWPRQPGHTTVHLLVQRILDAADKIPR